MVCGTCEEWQFHHEIGPQAITSHYVRSSESGTITLPTLGANASVKTAAALHFAAGILNLVCLVHPSKSKILPHCIVIYDESRTSSNSFCTRTPPIFPLMPPSLKTMIIHDYAFEGAKNSNTWTWLIKIIESQYVIRFFQAAKKNMPKLMRVFNCERASLLCINDIANSFASFEQKFGWRISKKYWNPPGWHWGAAVSFVLQ